MNSLRQRSDILYTHDVQKCLALVRRPGAGRKFADHCRKIAPGAAPTCLTLGPGNVGTVLYTLRRADRPCGIFDIILGLRLQLGIWNLLLRIVHEADH